MIWLMTYGDLPTAEQAALLESTLAAAVGPGPQAPSIAAVHMAVTCSLGLSGTIAAIYIELGFAGSLAHGLFCLSRSVGVIAHAWEQMNQGGRNKGPTPPNYRRTYCGADPIEHVS